MAAKSAGLFLCLLFGITLSDTLDLEPLSPVSCPANDVVKHECYHMANYSTTCLNITTGSCSEMNKSADADVLDGHYGGGLKWMDSLIKALSYTRYFHHPWMGDVCHNISSGHCTVYTCKKECCTGWTHDNYGRCNKRAEHELVCENGGTRFSFRSSYICLCPQNFTGNRCETPICEGGCYNGGECEKTLAGHLCNCPPPMAGPNCRQVNCPECENGGQCVVDGRKAICLCKRGFYGKDCSDVQIDERCHPPNTTVCTDLTCSHDCSSNDNCDRGHICCTDGCCNKCVRPEPKECKDGDQAYSIGEMFMKDTCKYCTCMVNGSLECTPIICPDVKCQTGALVYKTGVCCPVCEDSILPGYKPPTFERCYNGQYLYPMVEKYTNIAYMNNLRIRAFDNDGQYLKLEFSPAKARHCECSISRRNPIPVTVFATDKYGQRSECHIKALVSDNTPPYFNTCPSNIYALENEMISWSTPLAYDNVGVRSVSKNRSPYNYFRIGNHTVTYTAYDYDGNQAICEFTVFIYAAGTDSSSVPDGLKSRCVSNSAISIAVGCIVGVIFILVMGFTVYYVKRMRQRPNGRGCRRSRNNAPVNTVSNAVYGGQLGPFPDFKGASVKLPPYSPPSNPPAYAEHDDVNTQEHVYEQPPKYEDIAASGHMISGSYALTTGSSVPHATYANSACGSSTQSLGRREEPRTSRHQQGSRKPRETAI